MWPWRKRRSARVAYLGYVGFDNVGDEACYEAFQQLLEARVGNAQIERLASSGAQIDQDYDLVVLGGGTLLGYENQYARMACEALDHGLPLAVIGTGVHRWTFRRPRVANPEVCRRIVNEAIVAGVRGESSRQQLLAFGAEPKRISVCGDLALAWRMQQDDGEGERDDLFLNVAESRGELWGDQNRLHQEMVGVVRRATERGWTVRLVPFFREDTPVCERLSSELDRAGRSLVRFDAEPPTVDACFRLIRGSRLIVSHRLHGAVLGVLADRPTLAIAYRPKCVEFMESVGLDDSVLRSDEASASSVLSMVDRMLDPSVAKRHSARAQRFVADYQERITAIIDDALRISGIRPLH